MWLMMMMRAMMMMMTASVDQTAMIETRCGL